MYESPAFFVNRKTPDSGTSPTAGQTARPRRRRQRLRPLPSASRAGNRAFTPAGAGACELLPKTSAAFKKNLAPTEKPPLCSRCGECCRKGGPALHHEDLPLLRTPGGPDLADLMTLRAGEPALDQVRGRVEPLAGEIVKLRGRGTAWTCLFFQEGDAACAIYRARPLECRALSCQDTRELERVYAKDRLTRRDILPTGHPLLELIEEHERRCPVAGYARLLGSDAPENRRSRAEMLAWDREVRLLVTEKSGMDPAILDFLFGRPLELLAPALTAARRRT